MPAEPSFHSLYRHGFARTAVAVPHVRVADPKYNAARTLELARRAAANGAALTLFPELGISAYSCEDLFGQDALLGAVREALFELARQTRDLNTILLVGAPLRVSNRLFNCAIALYKGQILGVTPKSYLPNYREFYEARQFAPAGASTQAEIELCGQTVPFGARLVFAARERPDFAFSIEICEDVWTPLPPSTFAALAGATVLCNLSASNITIGKADYRKNLCSGQSAKCVSAYLYSAAGPGESTTDLAWDGHALIYENGDMVAESPRFSTEETIIFGDIDLERLIHERARLTSYTDTVERWKDELAQVKTLPFDWEIPAQSVALERTIERFPFVPDDAALRDERCYEAYNIQVFGLMKRLQFIRGEKLVIGVSGGLDSTHALIVAAKTMDRLGLPRTNILGYTMPGYATSSGTKSNAHALMKSLGISAHEVDIKPSSLQMMKDIEHPFGTGEPQYDVTFENVQAGERTSHLFRLANFRDAIVLGTGDLSELALGWCTYGVGDHMSHYNVNASVPKTLIQHLIRYVIESGEFDSQTGEILQSILDTEISPELVPAETGEGSSKPAQSTQQKIGPYELQDFNLYYITRFGFAPSKVAFLSYHAWSNAQSGAWPPGFGDAARNQYTLAEIKHWLEVFCYRFFQISQFKRSTVPNAPKVGSGGSLSPRGDWRAPSDGESVVWLDELKRNVPDD